MSDRRKFNIHALYPADYCFDWKSFETDPEDYKFTEEDLAYFNAIELEKYERVTPMTPYEKRALRRWVVSGHSVMEAPPSRYGCVYPSCPAPDFLEVYRTDRELDIATKGMSKEQRIAYVKDYFGYTDETEQERQEKEEKELLYRKKQKKRSGCCSVSCITPGCSWPRKVSRKKRNPTLRNIWTGLLHLKTNGTSSKRKTVCPLSCWRISRYSAAHLALWRRPGSGAEPRRTLHLPEK